MIFGINITDEAFTEITHLAKTRGFKSTSLFVLSILERELNNPTNEGLHSGYHKDPSNTSSTIPLG